MTHTKQSLECPNPDYVINEGESTFLVQKQKQKGFSPFSAFFNLVNSIIGAGMLALPFAIKSGGLVLGISLLFVVALLSIYSLYILVHASEITQKFSYKDVAIAAFGQRAGLLFEFFVLLLSFGVCVGYVRLIGSMVPQLIATWLGKDHFLANKYLITGIIMGGILFPLSVLRKISFLGYTSLAAILSAIFVVVVVVIRFSQHAAHNGIDMSKVNFVAKGFESLFMSFPLYFMAYGSHVTVLPMYKEMKARSVIKMTVVVIVSVLTCFAIYGLIGITGYLLFLDNTLGNILEGFPRNDILAIVAQIFIVIVLVFSYPLMHYAARNSIESGFFYDSKFTWTRWVGETVAICGLCYLLGLLVPRIEIIFGVTGATAGVLVFYVFPTMLYAKVHHRLSLRISALVVGFISGVVGIACTVAVIVESVKSFEE